MKTSETHPIRLDFVRSKEHPEIERLGMTLAPGKKVRGAGTVGWDRDLALDLGRLKEYYNIDILISLLEFEELRKLGVEELADECRKRRVELVRFPIRDGSTPESNEEFAGLIARIGERLKGGSVVAVHCRGGLGRTGLTAACIIGAVSEGSIEGNTAIEMVRSSRPGTIETREQEKFVINFVDRGNSGL